MMLGAKPLPLFSTLASTSITGCTELARPWALPSIFLIEAGSDWVSKSSPPDRCWAAASTLRVPLVSAAEPAATPPAALARSSS